MYNKVECIVITCDNCKESFTDDRTGYSIYVDENAAHETADDRGWYSVAGKHYCPECYKFNDEEELILKPITAKN